MTVIGQSGGKGNQSLEILLTRAEARIQDLVIRLAEADAKIIRLEDHIRRCQEKERRAKAAKEALCEHGFIESGRDCPQCILDRRYGSSPSDVMSEPTCPACEGDK